MSRLNIDLPEDIHRKVKARAAMDGTTVSTVFRRLAERYALGDHRVIGMPAVKEDGSVTLVETSVVEATPANIRTGTKPFRSISKEEQARGKTRK